MQVVRKLEKSVEIIKMLLENSKLQCTKIANRSKKMFFKNTFNNPFIVLSLRKSIEFCIFFLNVGQELLF